MLTDILLFTLFTFLWRVLLVTDPAHLRPGALSTRLGTVHLVEAVLWVRYPHIPLQSVPRRLRAIASDLNARLVSLERSVAKDTEYRRDTFALLRARASYVNVCLTLALDSFADLDVPPRPKRGLINGLGRISQFMFGTAMAEDVSDMKSKYAYLTNIAASHQVITLTALHVQQVGDVASYTHTVRDYLNIYIKNTHTVFLFNIAHQALAALESAASSFVRINSLIIQNLVDATRGRVTAALFLFRDLRIVLRLGHPKYHLNPLFQTSGLQQYCPMLDVFLTEDATVVHVSFKSLDAFDTFKLVPFPFMVNDSVLALDLPDSLVLTSADLYQYAVTSPSDLNTCHSEGAQFYCAASLFAFLPLTGDVCEVAVTKLNSSQALSFCP